MNLVVGNNIQDRLGHGTAVYSIIKQNSPMKSTIYNINIFQDCDAVDEDLLISAILYIEENINCRVINISSGIKLCERLIEFRNICNRISDKGIFIVSAFDNDGAMFYPAAFDSVIGVDSSNDCLKISDYGYVENSPINIRAKGGFHKVCWTDPEYVIVQGSSFSCAYITSIILDKIYSVSEMKSDQLHRILREYAKLIYNYNSDLVKIDNKYFNPKNVLLFPINKEMHSLLAFSSLLPFSISNITDLKISGNVNRKIEDIISFKKFDANISSLKIEDIDAIDWKSKFDTIIIGHVQRLSKIFKRDILKELLYKCIDHHKNVIALDDLSEYYEECSMLKKNNCLVYSSEKGKLDGAGSKDFF